tara:strand:- start:155 stop:712 length:558 start_codon:yes stop_codon:yes gene_type:complete
MKKSRRRILIPDRLFRNLPKDLKSKVNSYRGVLSNIVKQENIIKDLENEIVKCRKRIENYDMKLEDKNELIDNLRDDFEFTCSIVKTNPKGFEYYNLTISRRTKSPKNIYMGSEKKIKKHLVEYYKKDKGKLIEIEKDWLGVLGYDLKVGFVYDKLFNMMFEMHDKFDGTTMNLETLYPLDKTIK